MILTAIIDRAMELAHKSEVPYVTLLASRATKGEEKAFVALQDFISKAVLRGHSWD